jgi:uncharacterized radical SAM protein YgiQ
MGEQAILEIAEKMRRGESFYDTRQVAYLMENGEWRMENRELHSHEDCLIDSDKFLENAKILECRGKASLAQKIGGRTLIINPPFPQMAEKEIDRSFDLPYERLPHPRYKKRGNIPAYEMIKNSITTHRGCFGGCAFCAINAHQGKFIASRSEKSILKEVAALAQMPDFKGNISDLGGPSANMYKMGGIDKNLCSACKRVSCLFPKICGNLNTNHKAMNELYKRVLKAKGVKKVFIGSGVRYDMLLHAPNAECKKENEIYIENLILRHASGRLKLAPEHTESHVLSIMRKPDFSEYKKFLLIFQKLCEKHGLKTQIMPYLMSSHPGCEMKDMAKLSKTLKDLKIHAEQVQDFTPAPSTFSAALFYLALKKNKNAPYAATDEKEKLEQKELFFRGNKALNA